MIDFSELNDSQREAVCHPGGPLLVLAGAGSGKTRVITYRIARLISEGVKPWNILAMTFTNRAAAQMRERVETLISGSGAAGSVWISTYHSFCARFLRQEMHHAGRRRDFAIYDEDDSRALIKSILKTIDEPEEKFHPGALAEEISRAKDEMIDAAAYEINTVGSSDRWRKIVCEVYKRYQYEMEKSNALDFGDLQLYAVRLLEQNEQLLKTYQQRFRHLLIDEYQDTNKVQHRLVTMLAAGSRNLCVVGDDDQCIYTWRGSHVRFILNFPKEYSDARVVRLERNYRSTQAILDVAWRVVQNNTMRHEKKLWTEKSGGDPVVFQEFASDREEAEQVVGAVARMASQDMPLSSFAIFYRTNAQSRLFEEQLRRRDMPYQVVGSVRFYDRAEVKDAMAYLRLIMHPEDNLSFRRIVNVPGRGIGKSTVAQLEQLAAEHKVPLLVEAARLAAGSRPGTPASPLKGGLARVAEFARMMVEAHGAASTTTLPAMLQNILDRSGYIEWLRSEKTIEAQARLENLYELVRSAEEYDAGIREIIQNERLEPPGAASADSAPSPEKFSDMPVPERYLQEIALINQTDNMSEKTEKVTLMTLHLAKGLEFPAVFMTGLEEHLFPTSGADFSVEELEEERRLCYVGMTRAREKLFLTSAAYRRMYGQEFWRSPSRFIGEAGLGADLQKLASGAAPRPSAASAASSESGIIGGGSASPDGLPGPQFRINQRVRHPDFGPGRIISASGADEDVKVVVEFDSGIRRKLLLRYARLEPAGAQEGLKRED